MINKNHELIKAIQNKDYELVQKLIDDGINLNSIEEDVDKIPLIVSLKNSDINMFDYLIIHGANVTEKIGKNKQSLLYYALKYKAPMEIIKSILRNGGKRDINYAPKGMLTPGQIALEMGNRYLIEIFSSYTDIKTDNFNFKR